MKIILVTSYYYPNMFGGTEHSVKLLAEGLKDKGHEVYVISADRKDKEIEDINGIKVIRLNLKFRSELIVWKIIRKIFEFRNYMMSKKITQIIKDIKPDVIHSNNLFYISPIIWKIAKKNNIKVVHTLRDYWGICPKCTLLNCRESICKRRKFLCKVHQFNYESYAKYVDIVTAPSNFTIKKYKEYGIYNKTKSFMVSNAIDIDFNKHNQIIKNRLEKDDEEIKFLFIGSLEKFKGIEYLINTFKNIELKNIRLTICGVGNMLSYVQEAIKDDNRIEYLGRVDKEKKENVLLNSDVMIVPSIWYEPFGRVVIEGYKYAMPVIGTNIGGIAELLDDKVAISVESNSQDELQHAIEKLSKRDTVKKYLINTPKIIEKYNIEDQIKQFEKIYCIE